MKTNPNLLKLNSTNIAVNELYSKLIDNFKKNPSDLKISESPDGRIEFYKKGSWDFSIYKDNGHFAFCYKHFICRLHFLHEFSEFHKAHDYEGVSPIRNLENEYKPVPNKNDLIYLDDKSLEVISDDIIVVTLSKVLTTNGTFYFLDENGIKFIDKNAASTT